MDIEKLMEKYHLTGDQSDFLAAVAEYTEAKNRPTPSEAQIIGQIAGDLVDLDPAVALGALRGGGARTLHALAQKVRHQAGRPAVTDTKPGEAQAAAARREVATARAHGAQGVAGISGFFAG